MFRVAIVALALAADGGAATTSTAPAPPTCAAATKGVMWDYGTAAQLDVRRCDGISYVPYAIACKAQAASPSSPDTKAMCEQLCEAQRNTCLNSCKGQLMESSCREGCNRVKGRCSTRC